MGTRKAKKLKNNIQNGIFKPDTSRLVIHCGGVRHGRDPHIRCENDNTIQADLSVFVSHRNLYLGLKSADWDLANAKNSNGDVIVEPICGECSKKILDKFLESKTPVPEMEFKSDVKDEVKSEPDTI